jgi:hypothetical protein
MDIDNDELKSLIRENFPLVIGFSIPLVIFAIVMIVSAVNRAIIEDPQYSAVFVTNYNQFDRYKPYTVLVEHNKLVIEKNKPEPGSDHMLDYNQTPLIFLFDHTTLGTRLLSIDFNNVANDKVVSPDLTALNSHELITDRLSPDGYIFSFRTGKAESGLFSASFFHQGYAVYKGSKIINILYNGRRIPDPQFLAWVDNGP